MINLLYSGSSLAITFLISGLTEYRIAYLNFRGARKPSLIVCALMERDRYRKHRQQILVTLAACSASEKETCFLSPFSVLFSSSHLFNKFTFIQRLAYAVACTVASSTSGTSQQSCLIQVPTFSTGGPYPQGHPDYFRFTA